MEYEKWRERAKSESKVSGIVNSVDDGPGSAFIQYLLTCKYQIWDYMKKIKFERKVTCSVWSFDFDFVEGEYNRQVQSSGEMGCQGWRSRNLLHTDG